MPLQESRDPPDWFGIPAKPLLSVPGKASQVVHIVRVLKHVKVSISGIMWW